MTRKAQGVALRPMTPRQTRAAMARAAFATAPKGTHDMTTDTVKPTTLADMLAAVELGALDPSTPVVPMADIADRIRKERGDAHALGVNEGRNAAVAGLGAAVAPTLPAGTVALPAGVHDCAVSGCAHGAVHGPDYVPQPDRQTVLLAPCGSRIRVTNRALALAGGAISCGHGDPYAAAPRRSYTPRSK